MSRPTWCPDQACEFRGGVEPVLCGGRTDGGGRLCLCFDATTRKQLDKIADEEIAELQRLLARLYKEAK